MKKLSLSFYSFTCCGICKKSILDDFESFQKLLNFYNLNSVSHSSSLPQIDVSVIEGYPTKHEDILLLRLIRKHSKNVVSIGNFDLTNKSTELIKKQNKKTKIKKQTADYIKVDYKIPGCPINLSEFYDCLMDIYWDKKFVLTDLSVCTECKKNENQCFIKNNRLCMGPVTRSGCNSICINNELPCLGCRARIPQPNLLKLEELLEHCQERDESNYILEIFTEKNRGINE